MQGKTYYGSTKWVANIGNGEIPVSARIMAADFLDPVAGVLGRGIRRDKGTS